MSPITLWLKGREPVPGRTLWHCPPTHSGSCRCLTSPLLLVSPTSLLAALYLQVVLAGPAVCNSPRWTMSSAKQKLHTPRHSSAAGPDPWAVLVPAPGLISCKTKRERGLDYILGLNAILNWWYSADQCTPQSPQGNGFHLRRFTQNRNHHLKPQRWNFQCC